MLDKALKQKEIKEPSQFIWTDEKVIEFTDKCLNAFGIVHYDTKYQLKKFKKKNDNFINNLLDF